MSKLFEVYPLFDIEPVKGEDCYIYDSQGEQYLDLYGGHAVISIGHSHPHYIWMVQSQLHQLGFYSNSIQNPLQVELAEKLGELSGYPDYKLFLCNSGAEANENALKLASFHNQKRKVITFEKGFHGRTAGAVAITANPKICPPVNDRSHVVTLKMEDVESLEKELQKGEVTAVIVEGIQGIAGIYEPSIEFLKSVRRLCDQYEAVFIADEIQSGYGRSGKFFAHQYADVQPDVISMAKGMGNGFPIGGILIHPKFEAWYGMLGTTFGGNHLACAAGIAVLDVLNEENLMENAQTLGNYLTEELQQIPQIKEVRGKGLMIGMEFDFPIKQLRTDLIMFDKIFTGSSANPNTLRILPPLNIKQAHLAHFISCLRKRLRLLGL